MNIQKLVLCVMVLSASVPASAQWGKQVVRLGNSGGRLGVTAHRVPGKVSTALKVPNSYPLKQAAWQKVKAASVPSSNLLAPLPKMTSDTPSGFLQQRQAVLPHSQLGTVLSRQGFTGARVDQKPQSEEEREALAKHIRQVQERMDAESWERFRRAREEEGQNNRTMLPLTTPPQQTIKEGMEWFKQQPESSYSQLNRMLPRREFTSARVVQKPLSAEELAEYIRQLQVRMDAESWKNFRRVRSKEALKGQNNRAMLPPTTPPQQTIKEGMEGIRQQQPSGFLRTDTRFFKRTPGFGMPYQLGALLDNAMGYVSRFTPKPVTAAPTADKPTTPSVPSDVAYFHQLGNEGVEPGLSLSQGDPYAAGERHIEELYRRVANGVAENRPSSRPFARELEWEANAPTRLLSASELKDFAESVEGLQRVAAAQAGPLRVVRPLDPKRAKEVTSGRWNPYNLNNTTNFLASLGLIGPTSNPRDAVKSYPYFNPKNYIWLDQTYEAPFHPDVSELWVLVVSDDTEFLTLLREAAAKDLRIHLKAFDNVPEASAELTQHADQYQVVLTDLLLGQQTGMELATKVQVEQLPCYVVLSSRGEIGPERAFLVGFDGSIPNKQRVSFSHEEIYRPAGEIFSYLSNLAVYNGHAYPQERESLWGED